MGIYVPVDRAPAPWRREAYVWGGLTSGSRSRAFWLLMLPFALANIAFYMTPAGWRTAASASPRSACWSTPGSGCSRCP
nr:hypothetical protein GCM10020093_012960 [Planobispora longispora]